MKTELREKVKAHALAFDLKITDYFTTKLDIDNTKSIEALNLSLSKKVNIFYEMVTLTKIEKAKLNVFLRISKEIISNNKLNTYDEYFSSAKSYLPFLFNVYLESNVVFSVEEKFNFVVDQLINDVDLLITYHIKKPQVYYHGDLDFTF